MSREMKHSGIPWIGEIPKEWNLNRIKNLFRIVGGNGFKDVYQGVESGDYPFYKTSDINGLEDYVNQSKNYVNQDIVEIEGYNVIPCNSIIVSKIGAAMLKNHRKISSCECCIDNNLQALLLTGGDDVKYLYYLLKIIDFAWFDNNSTIPSVNNSQLKDFPIPLPPLPEQQKIASFLDKKCSEIDEMVVLQEKIIEELKAYKQSVITEAVTKGLNPDVPMKDSEIMFVDKIPSHWKETKTLRLLSMPITDGPHETPEGLDDGIPFISADAVSDGYINFNNKWGYISKEYYDECCKKYTPRKQDIYMIKSGASTGRTAIVDTDEIFTIWSPLAVFRSNQEVMLPHFLLYVLRSDSYQKQVESKWSYGTQQNIGMRTLEKLIISYPPLSEQQEIADYLDKKCSEIDSLISIKQSKIESLKEYKKSIIYEYVTGKKEVI